MYSIGYELEFDIPLDMEDKFKSVLYNPALSYLGYDGIGPRKKEYRSEVFRSNDSAQCFEWVSNHLASIMQFYQEYFHATYTPFILVYNRPLSSGFHVSFGEDFLKEYNNVKKACFSIWWKILLKFGPKIFLYRLFKVQAFRDHKERVEFRLIPTCHYNQIDEFLHQIRKRYFKARKISRNGL